MERGVRGPTASRDEPTLNIRKAALEGKTQTCVFLCRIPVNAAGRYEPVEFGAVRCGSAGQKRWNKKTN